MLATPLHKIRVCVKRVGGSYGGKGIRVLPITMAVALAAKIARRPVRCILTRKEDLLLMGQRGEFKGEYKVWDGSF